MTIRKTRAAQKNDDYTLAVSEAKKGLTIIKSIRSFIDNTSNKRLFFALEKMVGELNTLRVTLDKYKDEFSTLREKAGTKITGTLSNIDFSLRLINRMKNLTDPTEKLKYAPTVREYAQTVINGIQEVQNFCAAYSKDKELLERVSANLLPEINLSSKEDCAAVLDALDAKMKKLASVTPKTDD